MLQADIQLNVHENFNGKTLDDSLNNSPQVQSVESSAHNSPSQSNKSLKNLRSIHTYDQTMMNGFYEASWSKFQEFYPKWNDKWSCGEPLLWSSSINFVNFIQKWLHDNKEQVMILPNFDYGDVANFERFLYSLKTDGVNFLSKFKSYLNNKDVKKMGIDLALFHAKYGILLFEVCKTDHLDSKRKLKAKANLNAARSSLESLVKLILESRGLNSEHSIPVHEFIVLPNVIERPLINLTPKANGKPMNAQKIINFITKLDLEDQVSFGNWWNEYLALKEHKQIDLNVLNFFTSIIGSVLSNSVLPVVLENHEKQSFNVGAEFFHEAHENVRALSKVLIASKDSDKIRRALCLQILWLLLNDSQKKVSVVCSEQNKLYYEEWFARQRKLYSSLNNVRFYSDLKSCAPNGQTTKKEGDLWFFDCELSKDVIERLKELHSSYWLFSNDCSQWLSDLEALSVKNVDLDFVSPQTPQELLDHKPWLSGLHLKLPLRLTTDLLVIGDLISQPQIKLLQSMFKNGPSGNPNQYQQKGALIAAKKLKTIKFIRGSTIDSLQTSIKMHDSINAQVVLLHIGDEDVIKSRNAQTTIDRIKELTALIKEYCPKAYIVMSTLMRRASKGENLIANEVNKAIVAYCKSTREQNTFFYMLNSHFDPDYHTREGRILTTKGLRLYVDNVLFVVERFLGKNNYQNGNSTTNNTQSQQQQQQSVVQ